MSFSHCVMLGIRSLCLHHTISMHTCHSRWQVLPIFWWVLVMQRHSILMQVCTFIWCSFRGSLRIIKTLLFLPLVFLKTDYTRYCGIHLFCASMHVQVRVNIRFIFVVWALGNISKSLFTFALWVTFSPFAEIFQ